MNHVVIEDKLLLGLSERFVIHSMLRFVVSMVVLPEIIHFCFVATRVMLEHVSPNLEKNYFVVSFESLFRVNELPRLTVFEFPLNFYPIAESLVGNNLKKALSVFFPELEELFFNGTLMLEVFTVFFLQMAIV